MQVGSTMVTPQFLTVGAEVVYLRDLSPKAADMDDTYDKITVQTLSPFGFTADSYTWTNSGGESWDETGWVDDKAGDNRIADPDTAFAPGTSLWISGATGLSIQSAGVVNVKDVVSELRAGSTAVGNPFPVTLKLWDITPGIKEGSGKTLDDTYDKITVQTLSPFGFTVDSYTWTNSGGESWGETGWVDDKAGDNRLAPETLDFPAGAGLWISGDDGLIITIPAPQF